MEALRKAKMKLDNLAVRCYCTAAKMKEVGIRQMLKNEDGDISQTVIIVGLCAIAAIAIVTAIIKAVKGRSDEIVDEINAFDYVK